MIVGADGLPDQPSAPGVEYDTSVVPNHKCSTGPSSRLYASGLQICAEFMSNGMRWLRKAHLAHTGAKRMRVVETVALGEKRFAALLEVDGLQFLIGGGAGTVSLLTTLPKSIPQAAALDADNAPLVQEGAKAAHPKAIECRCAL